MRILCENVPHSTFTSLIDKMKLIGDIAMIKDQNKIAVALNEFKPHILVLKEDSIDSVIKAYSDKNKVKIISFGSGQDKGDINLRLDVDIPMANLDVIKFKENVDKVNTSVFSNNDGEKFISEFLCKNYNVNVYGSVKVQSPRYLGFPTNVEKYEILNKSKFSIVFNLKDAFDSVLLDTYPIVYGPKELGFRTFQDMVSLMEVMDSVEEDGTLQHQINMLKSEVKTKNSTTFVRDILYQLGFHKEGEQINNTLKEQI